LLPKKDFSPLLLVKCKRKMEEGRGKKDKGKGTGKKGPEEGSGRRKNSPEEESLVRTFGWG
jgi:hypothetical protein